MKIGVDALFENLRTGTGGMTYLRQMIRHLALLAEEKDRTDYYAFVSPSSREAYPFPGVTLVNCGVMSEWTIGRILAQQIGIPIRASSLGLSCLLCPGNVAPVLAQMPTVVVIQNRLQFEFPPAYGWGRRLFRRVISTISVRRAAAVVAVSQDMANYLVTFANVPPHKVKVVYHGIDWMPPTNSQKLASPLGSPYILNVSRLWDHKNQATLIKAFALLLRNKAFANCRLVIIGGDWAKRKARLQQLASQLRVADSVLFLGHIPRDELLAYYQNASVFVLPSLIESFGLPILEAMSQGVPVVASNCTAIPEIAGDAALIVEAKDVEAMSSGIIRFLTEEKTREEFIARGYQRVRCFNWTETARQMHRILRDASRQI